MLVQQPELDDPVLPSDPWVGRAEQAPGLPSPGLAEGAEPLASAQVKSDMQSDWAVRRELLRLALLNVGRSVPLQVAALGVIVVLGLAQNLWLASAVTGALGCVVAVWRWMLVNRYEGGEALTEDRVHEAETHLQVHSSMAGCVWIVATVWIYPNLPPLGQQIYVLVAAGSLSVAAFFLSLVGWSFELLAVPLITALAGVHVFDEQLRSIPLAVLIVLFALTMLRGTAAVRLTTTLAIRSRFAANAAVDSLRQARDAAEAANLAKSQFLATMSHEIRTPMNGVLGSLELLRASALDDRQQQLVRSAASSGQALMEILNDVLDHAKIEAGKLTLVQAPMSAHALVGAVAALFRSNAEHKRLSLVLDIEPGTADRVWGDVQRLKQVLLNLISNAIKFTERGTVTLRLRPAPALREGHAGLSFEVADTGIGIPEAALPGLFEPFHQVSAGNRSCSGTGLGLAISQRIVEAMGGRIEVHSEPGRGSRFCFTLQFRRDTDEVVPVAGNLPAAQGVARRFSGWVLVVEDDPVNRLVAVEMLRHLGLSVVEAGDGLDALQQLVHRRFSLVLMDCSLPVLDGFTATVELRQREARQGLTRVPVIATTAHALDRDASAGQEAGMDGMLAKPYTLEELSDVLARWLPQQHEAPPSLPRPGSDATRPTA
jgi:signal transduction histidine kinase/CheY-like chemotaxis protein